MSFIQRATALTAASTRAKEVQTAINNVKAAFQCKIKVLESGAIFRIKLTDLNATSEDFSELHKKLRDAFPKIKRTVNSQVGHSQYVSYEVHRSTSSLDFITVDGLYGMLYIQ